MAVKSSRAMEKIEQSEYKTFTFAFHFRGPSSADVQFQITPFYKNGLEKNRRIKFELGSHTFLRWHKLIARSFQAMYFAHFAIAE